MSSRRLLGAVLVMLGLCTPAPVAASNDTGMRVPDGQHVLLFNSNLDSSFSTEVTWVRANLINPTDVQTILTGSTATADVRMGLANYAGWPTNRWGEYQCMSSFWDGGVWICTDGRVRFHSDRPWDATYRRDFACHELGHALGLDHRQDGSCMEAVVPYGSAANPGYGSHSVGHLNTWY